MTVHGYRPSPQSAQPIPGFTSSRAQTRHWSASKQSPHRVRLGCRHDYAAPGEPHRTLTDPELGTTTVCEGCYRQATA
jgi:hypothetical protein